MNWFVYLTSHGVGVELAHVGTLVVGLGVGNVQLPYGRREMVDGDALVVCYDVGVNGLDSFGIQPDPSDFIAAQMGDVARQQGVLTLGHRHILSNFLEVGKVSTLCNRTDIIIYY